MPPPSNVAVLPLTVLLLIVRSAGVILPALWIPPPRRSAELPLIVQLLTVSVEWAKPFPAAKQIPPPPVALSPPAVLPLITQLLSVTVSVSLLLFSSSQ